MVTIIFSVWKWIYMSC